MSGAAAGREVALVKVVTTIGKPGVAVAAITKWPHGFAVAHVEGTDKPTINGAAIGADPVELKNGDEAYGLIVSETADELAIKAVGGAVTRYKKADILQRQKQKVSIMPSGLQQAMTIQELVDLVEYLATLRVPKP